MVDRENFVRQPILISTSLLSSELRSPTLHKGTELLNLKSAFSNLKSPGALLLPRPELLQVFQARPERRLFMRLESNHGSLFLIVQVLK
jgi:hypothetical protein